MSEIAFLIGDIIMFSAPIPAIIFAVSYWGFFNWRATPAGRSLMYLVLALIAWSTQSVLARTVPEYAGREWVRIFVFSVIAITLWRLVVTLWRSRGRTISLPPRNPKPDDSEDL